MPSVPVISPWKALFISFLYTIQVGTWIICIYIPHIPFRNCHLSSRQFKWTLRLLLPFNPMGEYHRIGGMFRPTTYHRGGWNLLVCLTERLGPLLFCTLYVEYQLLCCLWACVGLKPKRRFGTVGHKILPNQSLLFYDKVALNLSYLLVKGYSWTWQEFLEFYQKNKKAWIVREYMPYWYVPSIY